MSPPPLPTTTTPAASASAAAATSDLPPIQSSDLVVSLPAPILRLLVLFARPISALRISLEVVCWKAGRRVESWMLVGVWWAICLGSRHLFRWLLPPLVFLPLLPLSRLRIGPRSTPPKQDAAHPTTHEILLITLSDLHAIHALLPPSPLPNIEEIYSRFRLLGPLRLTRGLFILWVTWIILGRIVGFPALLALIGSVVILLPSPSLAHLYNLLSRSLIVRRAAALIFLLAFGSPPDVSYPLSIHFSPVGWVKSKWAASRRPSLAFTFRPKLSSQHINEYAIVDDEDEQRASEPIYFRFEVHENQRWWMGLDWTSALLPQERPSWCDSHLLPVSPPASFHLPASSSIILPSPTPTEPNGRIQRVATWRWLDDDWSIVRAGAAANSATAANTGSVLSSPTIPEDEHGAGGGFSVPTSSGITRSFSTTLGSSPPTGTQLDESQSGARAPSIAEQAFTKGLERLKARTTSPIGNTNRPASMVLPSPSRTSGEFKRGRTGSHASEDAKDLETIPAPSGTATVSVPTETIVEKDDATDLDGWVYGDNKWESMGPKGGLGKFTRRRRWQRRAVLTETVHRLPSETVEDIHPVPVTPVKPPPLKSTPSVAAQNVATEVARPEIEVSRRSSESARPSLMIPPASPTTSRDDVLRQRLKKAMGNVGG